MDYIEMTVKEVKTNCRTLSEEIYKSGFRPELVIFIARGAFQIGKIISENFKCPLAEIRCSRNGGKSKDFLAPVLKCIPAGIKAKLREKEMNKNLKSGDGARTTEFNVSSWSRFDGAKKILLVDDSIDSGYSMRAAYDCITEYFDGAEVKVAVINEFDGAEKIIKADYCLLRNKLISGPWSNDSPEHRRFLRRYEDWKAQEKRYEATDSERDTTETT